MPSTTVRATYANGSLRLDRPIDLADGTRVEVIVVLDHDQARPEERPSRPRRTPAELVAEIAAMPMESATEGFSGDDHDRILYDGEGGAR